MDTETKINHRLLGFLITPSWLSGMFVCLISIGVVTTIVVAAQLSGSNLREAYVNYETNRNTTDMYADNAYDGSDTTVHRLISSAPLMAFWSLAGVVVYLLASNIITAIQHAKQVQDGMNYVNTNRAALLKTVIVHFFVRCAVFAIWFLYILFFLHWIIPYVLAAATVGGQLTVSGVGVAALAIVVMAFSLHLHIVFLRTLLLKPRIFSRALYVA